MSSMSRVELGKKALLYGNEAVALASLQAGARFASGYPGTPSSEIIESFVSFYKLLSQDNELEGVRAEWAPNEKVAMEAVIGASVAGIRSFYTSKHVGLNVASDPLVSFAHTGVNAGAVIFVADDPSMHSSQNEQDSRWYSHLSRIPVFEPSDGEEAYFTVLEAFDISEKYDLPVIVRLTTRLSHSRWVVPTVDWIKKVPKKDYRKDSRKYVLIPAYARIRKVSLINRIRRFKNEVSESRVSVAVRDFGGKRVSLGIVSSSIAYRYVLEAINSLEAYLSSYAVSIFKPLVSLPFPEGAFIKWVKNNSIGRILVVEEGDNIVEREVKRVLFENNITTKVWGKPPLPSCGELTPDGVISAIKNLLRIKTKEELLLEEIHLPERPPVLCPGCPYRSIFYTLRKKRVKVIGDIGCYSLGVLPPLNSMDTLLDMGAGFGMAHTVSIYEDRVVGILGDSTFFHSGITPAVNVVYNRGNAALLVLDNRTTAMTGHQPHPGIERTAMGEPTRAVLPEEIAKAIGFEKVEVFDPFDVSKTEEAITKAIESEKPVFLVARGTCALLKEPEEAYTVISDKCTGCRICFSIACPAIIKADEDWKAEIISSLCTGCGVCAQVCPFGAIVPLRFERG